VRAVAETCLGLERRSANAAGECIVVPLDVAPGEQTRVIQAIPRR
jgi:hypothetical protein